MINFLIKVAPLILSCQLSYPVGKKNFEASQNDHVDQSASTSHRPLHSSRMTTCDPGVTRPAPPISLISRVSLLIHNGTVGRGFAAPVPVLRPAGNWGMPQTSACDRCRRVHAVAHRRMRCGRLECSLHHLDKVTVSCFSLNSACLKLRNGLLLKVSVKFPVNPPYSVFLFQERNFFSVYKNIYDADLFLKIHYNLT